MSILEYFSFDFVRFAFISCLLLSITSPILGVFLLLRRLSFFGAGLSNLSFAGIALGFLLKKDPILTSSIFTSFLGVLSYYIYITTKLPGDILISILFSLGLALAVFILGIIKSLGSTIFSYLFGSILLVTKKDLAIIFIFSIITLLYFFVFRKAITISLLSRELGKVYFKKLDYIELGFIFLSSLFVVFTIKIVGIILSTSFLVIPSLFGLIFGKSLNQAIVFGILFGVFSSFLGLIFSLYLNVPPGGTIVLTMTILLKLFYLFNYLFNRFFKKTFR